MKIVFTFLNPLCNAHRSFPHIPCYIHSSCIFHIFGWASSSICCNRFTDVHVLTVQTYMCVDQPAGCFLKQAKCWIAMASNSFKGILIRGVTISRNSFIQNEWELLIFETIPLADLVMTEQSPGIATTGRQMDRLYDHTSLIPLGSLTTIINFSLKSCAKEY